MVKHMEWRRGEFLVTCDPAKADVEVIAAFLRESYWAKNIPVAVVRKSIENSLTFNLLKGEEQIGFARAITDFATIGYLGDVFVLPDYRSQGLGKWLMECVFSHPELQGFRRWILVTLDAHKLYEQFGFTRLTNPELFMENFNSAVYQSGGIQS
jgi:N-acetylglutamate synthase-like GNAT family acetyltransferase